MSPIRTVALDTETTGFDPHRGDRIVEVGLVEIIDRRPTGRVFQSYVNPCRSVPDGAFGVHGLSEEFLKDKPLFASIAADFVKFIDGAKLVIHNAGFDIGFLNMELAMSGYPSVESVAAEVMDSIALSRKLGRSRVHSLDALCGHYGVNNKSRTLHGALLDAQLLGEVYIAMTREQGSFLGQSLAGGVMGELQSTVDLTATQILKIDVPVSAVAAHEAYLLQMSKEAGGRESIWTKGTMISA